MYEVKGQYSEIGTEFVCLQRKNTCGCLCLLSEKRYPHYGIYSLQELMLENDTLDHVRFLLEAGFYVILKDLSVV